MKQGVQSNRYDFLEQEQHYCFGSIIRIGYDEKGKSDRDPNLLDKDDTFHDSTQVEDVIKDTYDNDDVVNQKPIKNGFLQPVGERKGATGMMYEHEGVLYVQYFIDHLNIISLMPEPYSNQEEYTYSLSICQDLK